MTTTIDLKWPAHARRLADQLQQAGDIRSAAWHSAVAATPRHVLVPRAYDQDHTGAWIGWDTADHLDRVYAAQTLVTALESRGDYEASISSSTTPGLMLRMLDQLDVHDGHKMLEIGTGSGYNAALLSHRLGDDLVHSVDVDAELVGLARERLATIGLHPTLAAQDGADGLPDHAPYDRIIATCAVPTVPWAWAEQLRHGGLALIDIKRNFNAGNLALLHRHQDCLQGRFTARWASFMAMRHNQADDVQAPATHQPGGEPRSRATDVSPRPWEDNRVVWFLADLIGMPSVTIGYVLDPANRQPTAATLTAADGSTVEISLTDTSIGSWPLVEHGPTPLWPIVERAHELWRDLGSPGWSRLGLTVTADTQWVWIDEPHGKHQWSLTN